MSMPGRSAPNLLKFLVATACETVVIVTDRVLLVIVLVVILGRVELGGLGDLGYYGCFEGFALFQQFLRLQCQPVLVLIVIKNCTSILMPIITELAVLGCRVNVVPKGVQALFVSHFCRVIS